MSLIKTKLSQAFLFLQVKGSDFTVDDIYKQFKGETPKKEFDGELWINMHRNKTKRIHKVPLLPKAKEVKDKYEDDTNEYVFPSISNAHFNGYLKEIADVTGLGFLDPSYSQKDLCKHCIAF